MPLPVKMKIPQMDYDLDLIRRYLAEAGSTCEAPKCVAPAVCFRRSEWSFIWICEGHLALIKMMTASQLNHWDRMIAEAVFERMLELSFVHQNHKTGFELQAAVNERQEIERELDRIQANQRAQERRELRKAIQESSISIGAPDEQLLVARQRQLARAQAGKPTLGRTRQDKAAILRPKLIVSLNRSAPTTE